MQNSNRPGKLFRSRRRRIVIDTGEAVDLNIDKTRSQPYAIVCPRTHPWIDVADEGIELNFDTLPRKNRAAVTFHKGLGLCTANPQRWTAKLPEARGKRLVENGNSSW